MSNFFSYDSKPMQVLSFIGDLIILNVLYLLCCIPVFTIGAAQSGMHTAIKVLLDSEDDSSATVAYFKGFARGFKTVTLAWLLVTLVTALVIWTSVSAYMLGAPLWLAIVSISFCAVFQCIVPVFHARFECTVWQLIRNCWFMLVAHPLRCIVSTFLVWLPVLIALIDMYSFMAITPLWISLYFGVAFLFFGTFMRKPMKTLIDHYNETHNIPTETPNGDEETFDDEEQAQVPAPQELEIGD